jgi:hypothetical protein
MISRRFRRRLGERLLAPVVLLALTIASCPEIGSSPDQAALR